MDNPELLQSLAKAWLLPSLASGLAAFLLGILWYHPKMLGTKWLEARGSSFAGPSFASSQFIVTFPLWLITALFFTFMVHYFGISDPTEFFLLACLLWVAFSMPPIVMGSLYTGYPFNAVAIDAAYQLGGYYAIALVQYLYSCTTAV